MRSFQPLSFSGLAMAACNGQDAYCDRKYSDITMMGSHDSAFVGITPTHNQYVSITDQLNLGVRFLQAQTHDLDGTIEMCHSYCWELDAGPLTDYLGEIADWMATNTNEVVTVLLTNGDAIDINQFDSDFESAGLKDYVYTPPDSLAKADWPTLQEMIDAGTRLVVFMDYNMDESQIPYIMDEFQHWWETPYGITDSSFPTCDVDRPSGGDTDALMGIMNHMLNYEVVGVTFPDQDSAGDTNSVDSIQSQVDLCESDHSVQPNVILLDWINIGDAMSEQASLNGL